MLLIPQVFIDANKRSSHGPSPFTLLPNRDSVGAIPWLSLFCLSPGRSPIDSPAVPNCLGVSAIFHPCLVCEGLDYLFFLFFFFKFVFLLPVPRIESRASHMLSISSTTDTGHKQLCHPSPDRPGMRSWHFLHLQCTDWHKLTET